ncbi:MAG: serine/threonine protein kinase [Blastocatellia bacterium]|nr:serine/threonine protein kinase [Blastocatellia bacterium]
MALEDLLGKVLDEKYRLEEKLGQGGMGAVYLATHLGTERPVAVKIIAPQFMRHPEFVERFKREAKAAGRLRHPNVVDVTDFGFAQLSNERIAYLVMEYLDGCTLSEVLVEEGKLPLKFAVNILEQVCAAIDTAHLQGIIHRDLKPDNIWLEPDGLGSYNIKVLDFGLAKLGEIPAQITNGGTAIFEAEEDCFIQKIFNKGCEDNNSKQPNVIAKTSPQAIATTSSISLATTIKPSLEFSESATAVQPSPNNKNSNSSLALNETPTAVQTSLSEDEAQTQVQVRRNTASIKEDKIALVTHVGTVLGTPIYMSPEQCRGETLDTRSDVYSLGVIAYQMLTGNPPFSGDTQTLITHHTNTTPQNIKELRRDIPKAVSTLIMSALAKNAAERPATVAAFSTALKARSEGAASLLRQAISLYNNHFPTFIKISLISYSPVVIFYLLTKLNFLLINVLPQKLFFINAILLASFAGLSFMLSQAIVYGTTVPTVAQLMVRPFHKVELKPIFILLKQRVFPLITTKLLSSLFLSLWAILFVIPAIKKFIDYMLFVPVVMMENISNRKALKRSQELVKRLWWVVFRFSLLNMLLMTILFANGDVFSNKKIDLDLKSGKSVVTNSDPNKELAKLLEKKFGDKDVLPTATNPTLIENNIKKTDELDKETKTINIQTTKSLFSLLLIILTAPILSISIAMLYLKLRQAGGESFKEALGQFGENAPRSKWQLRMRERSRAYYRVNSQ